MPHYKPVFYCVCAVLKPLVEVLSDPDFLNLMLLSQLEHREQLNEHHKKAYTYAPSYEEFIKLISSSSDIDFLKQLRYRQSSPTLLLLVLLSVGCMCVDVLTDTEDLQFSH